jgi:DNA-directed RNA polymerase subunit RPC12/RpoP
MNKEKLIGLKKIVMNEIGQTLEKTTKHEIDFSNQMAIAKVLGDLTAILDIKIDDYIQSEQEETCTYTLHDDDSNTWKCSECGELWMLNAGTTKENNMNFCPNCGRKIVEKAGE